VGGVRPEHAAARLVFHRWRNPQPAGCPLTAQADISYRLFNHRSGGYACHATVKAKDYISRPTPRR